MAVAQRSVAAALEPAVSAYLGGDSPVELRFWDGSRLGPEDSGATLHIRSPRALRYFLWAPGELGVARAYVSGELDLEGDVYAALAVRERLAARNGAGGESFGKAERVDLLKTALRLGVIGPPPRRPSEEVRLSGGRHSPERDAAAISHHYDISNDFYHLVLGDTMTYSCACFTEADTSLEDAQRAKYDLVASKLGLAPGMRLLDVGCGWGGMVLHAAEHYGVSAVGITLSKRQAERARERVQEAGLEDRVEIRVQDYRAVHDGPYDAISSIGMFEHVGLERLREYFTDLRDLLREEGRLLNHGISRPNSEGGRTAFAPRSFVDRYVFPDGELHEVGAVVSMMQDCGLEVRDVESLREHYTETLRHWVANLEANWDEAVRLVGAGRARVWRLYMAASATNFHANRQSIHQVLGVRPNSAGESGMPRTRAELLEGWPRAARSRSFSS
ncbi:MAG: cyclopropane-fatty-acyl-phospholipid synthase [Acidimicrobiaceae bacterium]|nr:cyclopropane-fatty-acyl-phospholipid synthase [Acidimicrobiaceae bacterium]